MWAAVIAVLGVALTAFIQWRLGQRTSRTEEANAANIRESTLASKQAAAASERSAQVAVAALADSLFTNSSAPVEEFFLAS